MKRSLAILLCALCLITGCSKADNAQPSTAPEGSRAPLSLSLGLWEVPGSWQDESTDRLRAIIQERFNVDLVPYDMSVLGYAPEQAVAAPLPDMMTYPIEDYQYIFYSLVDMHRIRDIPYSLYADYPNMVQAMSSVVGYTAWEGHQYFVPRTSYAHDAEAASSVVIYYRRDWAESLGITPYDDRAPTWEEFIALLKAYTYDDPNRTDAADTWGLTTYGEGFGGLEQAFLMPFGVRDWVIEDNRWIPGYLSGRARDAMKWLNECYRSGYIDREYSSLSMAEAIDRFCVGRAGMLVLPATADAVEMLETRWKELRPENYIGNSATILPQPLNPSGTTYNETQIFQGGIVFNAELDDEQLRRALEVIDWLYSPEGVLAANYGKAGEDYTTVEDKPRSVYVDASGNPVPLSRRTDNMQALSCLATYALDGVSPELRSNYQQYAIGMAKAFWWPNTWARPMFTDLLLLPEASGYNPHGQIELAAVDLALYSSDIDAEWEDYVARVMEELGLESVISEVNGYAHAKGIVTEE